MIGRFPVIAALVAHVDWPQVANEELMPYFAPSGFGTRVIARRRRASARAARRANDAQRVGSLARGVPGEITSMTTLQSSLNTAITGSKVTFTATVENASTDAPIASGKVNFIIESPQKTVLGDIKLNKKGAASITTTDLTQIGNYRVEAQIHTHQLQGVSELGGPGHGQGDSRAAQRADGHDTLSSVATSAEVGQALPLIVTVKDAGTGVDVDAGKIEPMTGSVAFLTAGPDPIVLGESKVNDGQAVLSTSTLRDPGPYQIIAEFLPANNYYAESTSAPITGDDQSHDRELPDRHQHPDHDDQHRNG